MAVVARITKDDLDQLRVQQHAVIIAKNTYTLAHRGFSARIGEILRRYRREDTGERLRINFDTGDIETMETPINHMPVGLGIEPTNDVDTVAQQILDQVPDKVDGVGN